MKKLLPILVLVLLSFLPGAAQAQTPNPSNTVVRMYVAAGGTNFGSLDLELYDRDKPESVRNFLLYVYSGSYSNLLLHRLVNNFVLQAGYASITNNLTATNEFNTIAPTLSFGTISNEFNTGTIYSNLYGTLVMARLSGETNSASTEWFINLTNSPSLDSTDGGFTVFGRVVNTTNEFSGTNMLNYLAHLPVNFAVATRPGLAIFNELPVTVKRTFLSTNGSGTVITNIVRPRYHDLITFTPIIIQGGQPRDPVRPTVTLSTPSTTLRTTNDTIPFAGQSADNGGVARVLCDTEYGLVSAEGTSDWSVPELRLRPGTNYITVRSLDFFGNFSDPIKRTVFYSVPRRVTLTNSGDGLGKVTGLTNGQILELGVFYKMTATPRVGHYFSGWGGDITARDRSILLFMQEGVTNITTRFTTSFIGLKPGVYNGLIEPLSTNALLRAGGFITLTVSKAGSYFGRLMPFGANYAMSGKFDQNGNSFISGRRGVDTLVLQILLSPDAETVTGFYSDGHYTSRVILARAQTFTTSNAVPAGHYTFNITPTLDTNVQAVHGHGAGTVVVDAKGKITMSGTLGDGTVIKQTTKLLRDDNYPFYSTAHGGRGGIIGWATFESNRTFQINARWFNPAFTYPTGQLVRVDGSPYVSPALERLFDWTNGVVTLSGDGLAAPVEADVLLHEDGSFSLPANPNQIQLNLVPGTGLFSGSFRHPVTQAVTPLKGAVLQSSNRAAGHFTSSPKNGAIVIRGR